jgi:hypothetical protein
VCVLNSRSRSDDGLFTWIYSKCKSVHGAIDTQMSCHGVSKCTAANFELDFWEMKRRVFVTVSRSERSRYESVPRCVWSASPQYVLWSSLHLRYCRSRRSRSGLVFLACCSPGYATVWAGSVPLVQGGLGPRNNYTSRSAPLYCSLESLLYWFHGSVRSLYTQKKFSCPQQYIKSTRGAQDRRDPSAK